MEMWSQQLLMVGMIAIEILRPRVYCYSQTDLHLQGDMQGRSCLTGLFNFKLLVPETIFVPKMISETKIVHNEKSPAMPGFLIW